MEEKNQATETAKIKETPVKTEVPSTSGFAGKSFAHNGKKYGFNMPASEFKNEKGVYVPYTYEEVLEDENLQKYIAELCDKEETYFVKILN